MQFLIALVACFVVGVLSNDNIRKEWIKYKLQYNKSYGPSEDKYRQMVWEDSLKRIYKHNVEASEGIHSYTVGINIFSDMTHEEITKLMTGLKISESYKPSKYFVPTVDTSQLPTTMNWTARGYVTEVGNQLACGSCWAFSILGALEGQWKAVHNKLVRLSVQDLMDCSGSVGNQGCEGGYMDKTYTFIKNRGGVDTWASYPYTAKNGKCKFSNSTIGATCSGYVDIKKGDEMDLFHAVATVGPVAVAMDATQASFQMYKEGVYDDPHCSTTDINHTMVIVGYGTHKGKEYWLAKNSWGTSWGMNGYILMSRNKNNQCGIASLASFPTVK